MILVIGARSKVGSALLEVLVSMNEPVRALVRSEDHQGSLPIPVDAVVGDLADPESLSAAMSGAERVFLLSSPHPDAVAWHRNAIDAARGAHVDLLVRSSILGAELDSPAELIHAHGVCDRYLEQSGLKHVILRPNLFLQNVPDSTIPAIDEGGSFYLNAGDARISVVDTRDVADVAAVVLTEPGHEGARYNVTGPDPLSYDDVAIELSRALRREVRYVRADDEAARDALLKSGLDAWSAGALVDLFRDYRESGPEGYAAQVSDTIDRLTGKPARTLDELLRELTRAGS